jgi:hypothetical protein
MRETARSKCPKRSLGRDPSMPTHHPSIRLPTNVLETAADVWFSQGSQLLAAPTGGAAQSIAWTLPVGQPRGPSFLLREPMLSFAQRN